MRRECISSIGMMEEQASAYAPLLANRLFYETSVEVRAEVAKALGNIGNKQVIGQLKEVLEEITPYIEYYESLGAPFDAEKKEDNEIMDDYLFLLSYSLKSLFQLDFETGEDTYEKLKKSKSDNLKFHAGLIVSRYDFQGKRKIITANDEEIKKYGRG